MTILKHKSGKYEKNYCTTDSMIESKSLQKIIRSFVNIELEVYKAHLTVFDSFYGTSAYHERYFAMHRAYLLARLELREGAEDSVIGVVPQEGDLDDLDAYLDDQEKSFELVKNAIAMERELSR